VESYISAASWQRYRDALIPIIDGIPNDFVSISVPDDFDKMPLGLNHDEIYKDTWGCVWHCRAAGMQGIINHHPLQNSYDALKIPDPHKTSDLILWDKKSFESQLSDNIKAGRFSMFGGERLWERVHFLRGYQEAMLDMAEDSSEIRDLISKIVEYNIESTKKYLSYEEVDCILFQDDWGNQNSLMVSPGMWREYFYDGYKKMFQSVKDAGKYVYFHTDGHLYPVIGDLIQAGADIINLQSGCHTIEGLYDACYGKVCASVDIDRQHYMPYESPDELKNHIREIYYGLKGNEGGVWVKMDVYPDVPLANIEAMRDVFIELRSEH